jgi:(E)-4-hydroxy-3-methylbut-2-enyl-diphosphate synthase
MIQRRQTKTVTAGPIKIGSGHPIPVQTMTKVFTTDVDACVQQIEALHAAGCDMVRIAVPTKADTEALAQIIRRVSMPVVADVHFAADRAIEAIEAGAIKIRLNPGNVKNPADIRRVIDCAKAHKAAIRAGVNEASIRDLKEDVPAQQRTTLMLDELRSYVKLFEDAGFENLVLSAKSANALRTIEVNRAIAAAFDYPIHVGLTHAGLPEDAVIPSATAIGALLSEGIGDTIRVSIAGDPVQEIQIGKDILRSLELLKRTEPELIVCPTCGRCRMDVQSLARQVKSELKDVHKPLRIAVMGCIVNGPGEAADADLAVCAAEGKGYLYARGQKLAVVPAEELMDTLKNELGKL